MTAWIICAEAVKRKNVKFGSVAWICCVDGKSSMVLIDSPVTRKRIARQLDKESKLQALLDESRED
jgi:hypothetical protein